MFSKPLLAGAFLFYLLNKFFLIMRISKDLQAYRDEKIFHLFFMQKLKKEKIAKILKISLRTVDRYLEKYK